MSSNVTQLLVELRQGKRTASDQLWTEVYEELHQIAHRQLRRRRPGQTLGATDLVHEAYLKLIDPQRVKWQDRLHFFAVAATAMRHILIDYARKQQRLKRGGDKKRVTLDEMLIPTGERADIFLALDEAIRQLSEHDERMSKIVEYRFFAGLKEREIAELFDVSPRTIRRDWRKARAWLTHALKGRDIHVES